MGNHGKSSHRDRKTGLRRAQLCPLSAAISSSASHTTTSCGEIASRSLHAVRAARSCFVLIPSAPIRAHDGGACRKNVRIGCESGEAKREQAACKPGSVTGPEGAGRWPFVWDARRRTPRAINPGSWAGNTPAEPCGPARRPYSILLPVGFALPPPSLAARCALTAPFHPCPAPRPFRSAESARPAGRFAFCGTFPGVAPAGHYPAPSSRGARTFLPPPAAGGHPSA